jgi:hypothetical protein
MNSTVFAAARERMAVAARKVLVNCILKVGCLVT